MLRNNRFYKGQDLNGEDFKKRMANYFNPYEYNLAGNRMDENGKMLAAMRTKSHEIRINKKS